MNLKIYGVSRDETGHLSAELLDEGPYGTPEEIDEAMEMAQALWTYHRIVVVDEVGALYGYPALNRLVDATQGEYLFAGGGDREEA